MNKYYLFVHGINEMINNEWINFQRHGKVLLCAVITWTAIFILVTLITNIPRIFDHLMNLSINTYEITYMITYMIVMGMFKIFVYLVYYSHYHIPIYNSLKFHVDWIFILFYFQLIIVVFIVIAAIRGFSIFLMYLYYKQLEETVIIL